MWEAGSTRLEQWKSSINNTVITDINIVVADW